MLMLNSLHYFQLPGAKHAAEHLANGGLLFLQSVFAKIIHHPFANVILSKEFIRVSEQRGHPRAGKLTYFHSVDGF